ncbi:MAG TPA: M13 family metallopeptidase [Terracidiphilus sp.]|jgi:endothelin-converting enzyme/putative endopeptidase|nr:M13 family metallopeptidase [Terracidiphilus sp.]
MQRSTALSLRCMLVLAAVVFSVLAPGQSHAQSAATSTPSPSELRVFDPSLIDTSVDPCENFYRYSCNGWFKKNPLPADQTSYGRFTELYELNRVHLRQILESAAAQHPEARSANEQKIGDEYASCMDTAAIDKAGMAPLQHELDRIAALKSVNDLPALLGHLHRIGVNAFFAMSSNQDFADASQVISFYYAAGLGLPERDYYTRTDAKSVEQRKQYVEHVTKMFTLAGEPAAQAARDAQDVLNLETRLAKASLTITEQRNPQNLNHPTEIASFGKELTHFSLASYDQAAHAPVSGKMNDAEPKFFAEFNTVLAETPLDQIKTYLRWHLLHAYAGTSMPELFEQESWNFYAHILNGAEKQQERWKRCTSRVDREMGEALGQAYVAKYFPPEAKQHALGMTIAIEDAMGKDIDSLDWMSAETKIKAREKLHTVMNKIGYPDKWRDYSKVEIVRGDALGNQMRVREFDFDRELAKIGKPVDKGEWYMSPPTVNAYYDPQQNNVNFPAGYFQPPFFSDKEDDAANYGDMGSTIGHELTHGFDDEGRQYDKDGSLRNWWTKEDEQEFNDRAECMVRQYDAIEAVPGVHLNGKLTLGENLADLGGLWLAWVAWLDKTEAAHLDMAAKTDGYTPDQRFWIAYAQQWCTQTRPEQLRTQSLSNEHAPDEYRTNVVLEDLPEFAKSFSCKKDSKMVAEKPCRVW